MLFWYNSNTVVRVIKMENYLEKYNNVHKFLRRFIVHMDPDECDPKRDNVIHMI